MKTISFNDYVVVRDSNPMSYITTRPTESEAIMSADLLADSTGDPYKVLDFEEARSSWESGELTGVTRDEILTEMFTNNRNYIVR